VQNSTSSDFESAVFGVLFFLLSISSLRLPYVKASSRKQWIFGKSPGHDSLVSEHYLNACKHV